MVAGKVRLLPYPQGPLRSLIAIKIMNYIKVKNPEDLVLKLQFNGEMYELGAKETRSFPNDVAEQWVRIYAFVSIDNTKDEPKVAEADVEKITKAKK